MSVLDNASKFGKPNQNLVLETAGRIWVKVQDRFYELDFRNQNKGTTGRVTNVTNNNIVETAPEQDMSQYVTKNYLKSTLTEYVTKRAWADVKETTTMLENSLLEGFTESISPITVNTMQVVVGSDQLQYDFIENYNTTEAIPGGFISENGEAILTQYHVKLKGGWIKHYTLDGPDTVRAEDDTNQTEIRSQYCRWHIADGEFDMGDSAYYVYIKVPRLNPNKGYPKKVDGGYILQEGGQVVDETTALKYKTNQRVGVDFGDAEYVLSTTAIEMDNSENNPDDSSYYYLLFAIINSPSDDGSRSYVTMNGFTEITPGRVTAYRFMSPDGIQYLNFLDKAFHLGDNNSYIDFDADTGLFTIKGTIVKSQSGDDFPLPCYRGEWQNDVLYFYGDSVTYNGEVWLNVCQTPNPLPITPAPDYPIKPGDPLPGTDPVIYPWKLYSSKAKNNFTSSVFTRSATKPRTPIGGSYIDPIPTDPDGLLVWEDGIPSEVANTSLWMSQRLFTEDGTYPQEVEWSEPIAAMDSADIDFEWSSSDVSDPGTPDHPLNGATWSNDCDETTIWMAIRKKSNGVWSSWNVSKIKGEKGESPLTSDLTDEVTGITVGSDGDLDNDVDSIEFDAHLFYGVDKQTVTKIEITNPDATHVVVSYKAGSNYTTINGSITISDQDPTLHIKVKAGWDLAVINPIKIGIKLYCSLGSSSCTHTIVGIPEGEDGAVFKLITSVDNIQKYKDGTYSTGSNAVSCTRYERSGRGELSVSSYGYLYAFIDDSTTPLSGGGNVNTVTVPYNSYNGHKKIIFKWYSRNTISDTYLVDRETVPIIEDAIDNITIDLTNDVDGVAVGSDGVYNPTDGASLPLSTTVSVYYGLDSVNITDVKVNNIALPTTISGISIAKVKSGNNYTINFTIPNNTAVPVKTEFTITAYYTINGTATNRTIVYTLVGVPAGKDGQVFALEVDPQLVIKYPEKDESNSFYNATSISVTKTVRTDLKNKHPFTESDLPGNKVQWRRDGTGSWNDSACNWSSYKSDETYINHFIEIRWIWTYNGTDILIDKETVPVIRDGKDGTDGYTSVTLTLYKRGLTEAEVTGNNGINFYSTYTPVDGILKVVTASNPNPPTDISHVTTDVIATEANSNGWATYVPSGTKPVWVTTYTYHSNEGKVLIKPTDWKAPQRISGANGTVGKTMRGINEWSASGITGGRPGGTDTYSGSYVNGYQGLEDVILNSAGDNECIFYDVVYLPNDKTTYYYCRKGSQATTYAPNSSYSNNNGIWVKADKFDFIATNVLLAQNAHIDVTDGSGFYVTNTAGQVVAGMHSNSSSVDEVNIFAGISPESVAQGSKATVDDAKFKVWSSGKIQATDAEIKGKITAEGTVTTVDGVDYAIESKKGLYISNGITSINGISAQLGAPVNSLISMTNPGEIGYNQIIAQDENGQYGNYSYLITYKNSATIRSHNTINNTEIAVTPSSATVQRNNGNAENIVSSSDIIHLRIVSSVDQATDNDTIYFIEG